MDYEKKIKEDTKRNKKYLNKIDLKNVMKMLNDKHNMKINKTFIANYIFFHTIN